MENPGHPRSKERNHIRRPLLFLIGGVPTGRGRDRRRDPRMSPWKGERQEWQGAQPPSVSSIHRSL